MKSFIFVALLAALAVTKADKVDYSGHMVIRVVPETESQLRHLLDLEKGPVDFFSGPSALGRPVDIRVSPQSYYELSHSLALKGLQHVIIVADIGKRIEEEQKEIMLRRALYAGKAFDLQNYHTYAEIVAFMNELATTYKSHASVSNIGKTHEGFDITMLTVGAKSSPTKPAIYFDCAMHAREWIAPAVCLWIANELVTKYGSDANITKLVDEYDWLMVPVQNPEGYNYTWNTDRMWRKNRQPNSGALACVGTDPNRNFADGFGLPGASDNTCSETYHGPSAFSAPEAAAMRDVLKANRGRVKASFTIHSYSQLWMSPYGYTNTKPDDYTEMYRVMDIGVKALTATYGTKYTYGDIYSTIYQASGSTVDYTYTTEKIIYSYALEMRDTGNYGFQLPANQIAPTSIETWNGLRASIAEFK